MPAGPPCPLARKLAGLIGFMTEQGPFRPATNSTLTLNNYAWNEFSNGCRAHHSPSEYNLRTT